MHNYTPAILRRHDTLAEYDFVVLAFTHHLKSQFTNILETLDENFNIYTQVFHRNGEGFIVYQIPKDGANETTDSSQ